MLEYEDLANEYWSEIAPELFSRSQSKGVRMSDMGRCAREKWFIAHDKLTLPEDPRGKRMKLEGGTYYGARMACYIKAGIARRYPEFNAELEREVRYRNVPGHIDVTLHAAFLGKWPIEIKTNFRKAELKDPTAGEYHASFQAWQGAGYGLAELGDIFSVLTLGPAVEDSERKSSPDIRMDTYPTANFQRAVDSEIDRLNAAVSRETPPIGDVPLIWDWRCKFCRAVCPRNKNPRKELYKDLYTAAEKVFAEEFHEELPHVS